MCTEVIKSPKALSFWEENNILNWNTKRKSYKYSKLDRAIYSVRLDRAWGRLITAVQLLLLENIFRPLSRFKIPDIRNMNSRIHWHLIILHTHSGPGAKNTHGPRSFLLWYAPHYWLRNLVWYIIVFRGKWPVQAEFMHWNHAHHIVYFTLWLSFELCPMDFWILKYSDSMSIKKPVDKWEGSHSRVLGSRLTPLP